MSRNIDKANSVLVRYQEQQASETGGYKDYSRYKRPKSVNSVKTLKECLSWRSQIISEIKSNTTRIYDPSLDEVTTRDLNDTINDGVAELQKWDHQILKKFNHRPAKVHIGGKMILGKRYFGRSVELPEIKEVVEQERNRKLQVDEVIDTKKIPDKKKNKRYYSWDNADVDFEQEWTHKLREYYKDEIEPMEEDSEDADFQVPTLSQMEVWLVERRKQKLLQELQL
ncbi:hypothetical protein KAFR_0I02800 [Kazachstania africana CBS 2517]|uniref:Pre-mRNA-splicing factor ISY1 n=1 Tax=Kazachstania africana (strain ATCC 22294 / BCRC 22015 / CBS 2517 / CECT 1963 / NBRC 1671 / NRRL Y-8276) TaxID=1071382 RepID=H2B0A9_KAZAF|nr:hypothetical protein KAFR_0I02800 [Kazachstania africana CBS 2517]CCF60059.1 hypothetical protein KAFR_0I02800 [Kazachstania africana CBS 2517]